MRDIVYMALISLALLLCFALCGMSTYDVRRGFRHSECPLVEVKGEGEE